MDRKYTLLEAFVEMHKQEDTLLHRYEKIFKFDNDQHLDRFKLIILDLHADIEAGINLAIMKRFKIESDDLRDYFEKEILDKINFLFKAKILKNLGLLPPKIYNGIEKINSLRNMCAHPISQKVMYHGKNVKEDKRLITKVFEDIKPIYQHFKRIIL